MAAEQPVKPYIAKKIDDLQLPTAHQDDLSPGGDNDQFNGAANNHIYLKSNSTSAHLMNGKTITNCFMMFYSFESIAVKQFSFSYLKICFH